jgi:predicted aspartyl protease
MVNGIHIQFLFDTGASSVVLSPTVAERLSFDQVFSIANEYNYFSARYDFYPAPVAVKW